MLESAGINTRVTSGGEIWKLYIRYFVCYTRKIMEMNLKFKVFMKIGTDDEIDKEDANVSSDHFL